VSFQYPLKSVTVRESTRLTFGFDEQPETRNRAAKTAAAKTAAAKRADAKKAGKFMSFFIGLNIRQAVKKVKAVYKPVVYKPVVWKPSGYKPAVKKPESLIWGGN
jgi:hypothetical protein